MKTKKHFKSHYLNEQFDLGNIITVIGGYDVIVSCNFKDVPNGRDNHWVRNKITASLRKEGFKYNFAKYTKLNAHEYVNELLNHIQH